MIQLNLLPDLKKEFINAQKTKSLVITSAILVSLGAVGLSALLFVYVQFIQQVQIGFVNDSIQKKTLELKAIPDINKYLTIQNQLASLPKLHDEKGNYSRLFTFLGVLNPSPPNNIKLSNLQLTGTDTGIVLVGTTSTFEALNIFVDTLKNAKVEYKEGGQGEVKSENMFDQAQLQTTGLSKIDGKEVVSFTIHVAYKPAVFDARNTDMVAKVPAITTSPSVVNSPAPKPNLFEESEKP